MQQVRVRTCATASDYSVAIGRDLLNQAGPEAGKVAQP